MPIHCIIEVSGGGDEAKGDGPAKTPHPAKIPPLRPPRGGTVEVDDFVIIPVGTPFHELVTTVLTLQGYPKESIRQAEGTISLRNWKPLRLEQVCDSPQKTVGDILNDLTNHATLRVLVTRSKGGSADELKEKLLRLLVAQSSSLLMGGCPLDEVSLGSLVKGQWSNSLADDVKRRFDHWYASQHQGTVSGLVESLSQHHHHQVLQGQQGEGSGVNGARSGPSPPNNGPRLSLLLNGLNERPSASAHHHHSEQGPNGGGSKFNDENSDLMSHHAHAHHPVFHGLSAQKTRMRTSFDPEMELPKLQQWFADNPHPSRHQIQQYVRELNLLDCRKDRKPLDVNNVIYWFKNARAAQKRNELRYNGLPAHHVNFSVQNQGHDRAHFGPTHPQARSSSPPAHNFPEDHNNNSDRLQDHNNGEPEPSETSCSGTEGDEFQRPQELKVVIKEEAPEEDYISVDVEGAEGQARDLSSKSPAGEVKEDGGSSPTTSASLSPRSSPGLSPNPHFEFGGGPPSLVNRFHPFFEHPSFMAYRHFNSFSFGQAFPPEVSSNGSSAVAAAAAAAYEAALGGRKPLGLPMGGKRSPGSGDLFHDYPPPHRGHDPTSMHLDLFGSRPELMASIMNSNRGDLGLGHGHPSPNSLAMDERRKRNRTFIDPVTEVPRLEQWFGLNTHPSHNLILKYTEELNRMPYRQKFPKLEPKNVQFWFKNRRAKCKRLKMTIVPEDETTLGERTHFPQRDHYQPLLLPNDEEEAPGWTMDQK